MSLDGLYAARSNAPRSNSTSNSRHAQLYSSPESTAAMESSVYHAQVDSSLSQLTGVLVHCPA